MDLSHPKFKLSRIFWLIPFVSLLDYTQSNKYLNTEQIYYDSLLD
jgi:uncharacterized membrane protein YadS